MDFEIFVTPGLGDNSYLVWSEGEALMVDPQRDIWRFLPAIEQRRLSLVSILETHVHNDYLSGASALGAIAGAEVGAPARGGYEFPHRGLREGDEVRIGALRVLALETPGHTPEHLAYLVFEGEQPDPIALFSGGSLLVGSAGRTDLLGAERAPELSRAQFRSLRRLSGYSDDVLLLPTHGAGSFCATTAPGLNRTSTLGAERHINPALQLQDEETFLQRHISGHLAFPTYYQHMASINRRGAAMISSVPEPTLLTAAGIQLAAGRGAWIVDGRDRVDFARYHIPGSINIELNSTFATYVGWIVPFASQIALILPDPSGWEPARTPLLRIGYDRVAGYLMIDAWRSQELPMNSYAVAEIDDLCRACLDREPITILDVRQRQEWDQGHIPEKSLHLFVGDLGERLAELPRDTEIWTICASGYRAALAASLLDRAGLPVRLVGRGGVPEWAAHCYPQITERNGQH